MQIQFTLFALVQCPICGQWVISVKINAHIDANCPDSTASSSLSTSQPSQQLEANPVDLGNTKDTQRSSIPKIPPAQNSLPTRIAPLFAPKPAPQPRSQQQFPDRIVTRHNDNVGQKRATDSPFENMSMSPAKKKKTDAAFESMPLAARGKRSTAINT